jgi:hypothetical protein
MAASWANDRPPWHTCVGLYILCRHDTDTDTASRPRPSRLLSTIYYLLSAIYYSAHVSTACRLAAIY